MTSSIMTITGKGIPRIFPVPLIQVISNSLNLLGVDSNWQKIAKGLVIIVAIILDQQGSRLLDKIRVRKVAQEA